MTSYLDFYDKELKELENPLVIHWFRRDLRLTDNTALYHALNSGSMVLPVFIFDTEILNNLEKDDKRISFIYQALENLNVELCRFNSRLCVLFGSPVQVLGELTETIPVKAVYTNHDYEPYALGRDETIGRFLKKKGIEFHTYKDQVIFEKDEIVKDDGKPYTVFTSYSRKWKDLFDSYCQNPDLTGRLSVGNFFRLTRKDILPLQEFGFTEVKGIFRNPVLNEEIILNYDKTRNYPAIEGTSRLSVHLRHGTLSIRQMVAKAIQLNLTWLNELQWREFFMQILWHFPQVVGKPFKLPYERIQWINKEAEFNRWCAGETGYPLVDAGMKELLETGFMHNRVRMVTASFLTKHLLIDWRWGEHWFAQKLLDFELSSNNGNWQWAAGCGCDAAPYFRIFNPQLQAAKFDPHYVYIKKWVPGYESASYPQPMVEHSFARNRCLQAYSVIR
jgi:deoxyribodipyrimidine photo-lyase